MYLNSVTIVGFAGADPEPRQAKGNGTKFTVLSVATQRSWKNAATKITSWSIRADAVRRLNRGEPEPEAITSRSSAAEEAPETSGEAPY